MTDEMRDAVKALIRETLTVSVSVDHSWDPYSSAGRRVEVTLYLDGEKFSEDSYSFDVKED